MNKCFYCRIKNISKKLYYYGEISNGRRNFFLCKSCFEIKNQLEQAPSYGHAQLIAKRKRRFKLFNFIANILMENLMNTLMI